VSRTLRSAASVAVLTAALAGGLWWWTDTSVSAASRGVASETDRDAAAEIGGIETAASDRRDEATDPLATTSLRGTAVDGDVRFDANGRLVLDAELRRLFDYHLSLLGERGLEAIRALLRRTLSARLEPARIETVLAHFDRYTAYLEAVSRSGIASESDPTRRLAALRLLRRERLGDAMATGFFAEEEALADMTLRRIEIAADPKLDAERKREALAALDREAGYTTRASAELPDMAAAIERNARTASERDAERSALWGEDAARRLAALDAERAAWETRVRRYADARARIERDARLNPSARAQAIAALRGQMFDATEQRRIAALEDIGRLDATLAP